MFLIMVLLLPQFQLPARGCMRLLQRTEPCSESADIAKTDFVAKTGCAVSKPNGGFTMGLTSGADVAIQSGLLPTNIHTEAGLKPDKTTFVSNVEGTAEIQSRYGTDENQLDKRFRHLDTNKTTIVQLVESSVQNLINTQNDSGEQTHKKGEKTPKRKRLLMKHSGEDKGDISLQEHFITNLLEEYNSHCGDEYGKNGTYCDNILEQLEDETRSLIDVKHRKARHILEPKFLCGKLSPFRIDWYNPMSQICCNGIHDKVTGDEICCGNDVVNETDTIGCCGMETYNKGESLCCDDSLHIKSKITLECCGREVYDAATSQRCCNEKIHDSARQFCCDNQFLFDNIGKRNNHGGCCGSERFDSRCYSCNVTSRTIYPTFKPETQVCCQGRIKTIKQNKTECCGRRLMDPNIYQCVNGSMVLRPTHVIQDVKPKTHSVITDNTIVPEGETLNTEETNFEENDPVKNTSMTSSRTSVVWIGISLAGGFVVTIAVAIFIVRLIKRRFRGSRNLNDEVGMSSETGISTNPSLLPEPLETSVSLRGELTNTEGAMQSYQVAIVSPMTKVTTDSTYLEKQSGSNTQNLTSELSSDAETQTFETKRINVRDMFGNIYQYSCYLDIFNRTLTWDKSDCKMTLPESAVANHKMEAYASTFDDIPSIYEKFALPPETRLVSPVIEYRLPGGKMLNDFALVEMPFIGNPEKIEVWKCPSDEGMFQTLECRSVPLLKKRDMNSELFCHIENGKVRVYTKSFSIFFCTCQEQPTNLCLRAFLFGSYKKILDRKEVRLSLYIADELHTFVDYNQRMNENESRAERELKCEQALSLHKKLKAEDFFTLSMEMEGDIQAMWDHKLHPSQGRLLEEKHKKVELRQVARCCNSSRSLPYQVGWYLENKPNTNPDEIVQCVVDINCCLADESSDPLRTSIAVDELQLRAKDREQVPSEQDSAAFLKEYLIHHLEEERKTLLNEELKKRNKLRRYSGECQDLCKSLDYLYNDMKPAAFTRTVVLVLDDMHFDNAIDKLIDRQIISKAHLKRPFQVCGQENDTIQAIKNSRILPCRAVCAKEDGTCNLREDQSPVCRRELEETVITSYDDRNANQQEREVIIVPHGSEQSPTGETQHEDSDSESEVSNSEAETELKQIVTSL